VLEKFKGNSSHPYTREEQLSDRCFEVVYIITLLERGFGFDRHSRTITYALEVLISRFVSLYFTHFIC
jgi:hypothetical protein